MTKPDSSSPHPSSPHTQHLQLATKTQELSFASLRRSPYSKQELQPDSGGKAVFGVLVLNSYLGHSRPPPAKAGANANPPAGPYSGTLTPVRPEPASREAIRRDQALRSIEH